jgi:hypothetical protein
VGILNRDFGLKLTFSQAMDPQIRLLLESVYEGVEDGELLDFLSNFALSPKLTRFSWYTY